jgi:hypothetical protein
MNNKLTFTGGEPKMNENDFLRIQQANREFIQKFLGDFGECIIAGEILADPGSGNDLTLTEDAFVFLDGEVLKVDAGTYSNGGGLDFWRYEKVITYDAGGDKTYLDGVPRQTWEKARAVPTSIAALGAGDLDVINGKRWNGILQKVVDIGAWDMDTNSTNLVAHGIADHTKILSIKIMIYADSGMTSIYPDQLIDGATGSKAVGATFINSTNISLSRQAGGFFDAAGFSSVLINRGKIIIEYEL